MKLKRLARLLMAGTTMSVATWAACAAPADRTVMLTAPMPPHKGANQPFGNLRGQAEVIAQAEEPTDPRLRRGRGGEGGGQQQRQQEQQQREQERQQRQLEQGRRQQQEQRPERLDRPERPGRLDRPPQPEGREPQPELRSVPAQPPAAPSPSTIPTPAAPSGAAPTVPSRGAAPRIDDRERFGGGPGERRGVRLDDLRDLRRERVEQGGRRTIIEEPDRVIVREGDRYIVRHDETDRFRRAYEGADIRRERRGQNDVTVVRRPNGIEIITIRDVNGNLVRRVRREPGGRQIVLIENALPGRRERTYFTEVVVLPPPRIVIPRERYIVEVEYASQEDLFEAFTAPPIERIERRYTLDQVRQSPSLRERVRRVDVDTVTFDFGSWELSEEQARALTGVGEALRRAIERNPAEVFLIEGHTDAVGSEVDNLTLSDRRAETVATTLTEMFAVPAENLTTQGYGEQYLKINTQEPERANRRVTIRRITPLLREEAAR
jgi:outer membrane protein OmpA-like peptidoglycan-associated protein